MPDPSRRSGADTQERDAADSAANAARAPRPGLRERKKAATMHRIQTVALDLFEQYGFDTVSIEQVADVLTRVLDELWAEHFVKDAGPSWVRTRWCFEHPSIQGAMWVLVNEQVETIARAVSDSRRMPLSRARILASATMWGIVAVLRTWYEQDGVSDLRADIGQVIDMLARLEQTSSGS